MTIFLYKVDRFGHFYWGSNEILEYSKRRWFVNVGDTILFARGRGDELHFFGTSTVLDVNVEVQEQKTINEDSERLYVTKLQLDEVESLPSDRTLGAFMFSLTRVSNFSKPYLNFRHLGRIEEADLETLISGTINTRRSLYFGLLRHLPADWRAYLEYSSMAENSAKGRYEIDRTFPIYELQGLINKLVIQPLEISSETEPAFRKSLARMGLENPYVEAKLPDHDSESNIVRERQASRWSISKLINRAPGLLRDIQPSWKMINELLPENQEYIDTRRDGNKEWRPHRW
ncbi:hypothetical protein J4772_31710 [Cohnella sp. LGH]|uniref:hypothetical protein n=1 Tax=Cohnella sp. LGH TaxID=1619153 RepID=UPI001ADA703E|nr:hypothetical protein [Cohnella sp. LGH]QTH42029.1 hypothetical protein J4772_31710 [Cohnella sp. LGH]